MSLCTFQNNLRLLDNKVLDGFPVRLPRSDTEPHASPSVPQRSEQTANGAIIKIKKQTEKQTLSLCSSPVSCFLFVTI